MNTKNRFLKVFLSSLILLILFSSFSANAEDKYPTPTDYKYVNDYVGIITDSEAKSIISIGKELEDKTGAQAVIVIINSTEGTPIEDYANKLFRTWGIGQKEKDNGLLILLALDDRKWKVEVGRGLEGAIPDALSSRVMNSLATPQFKSGNYGEGLLQSYSAMADYIGTEYGITLDKSLNITLPNESSYNYENIVNSKIPIIIVVVLFFIDLIFNRGRIFSSLLQLLFWSNIGRGGRGPRGGSGGGGGGGGGFGGFGGGSSNGGGSSGSW